LQEQVLGETQVPFAEQTVGFEEFFPKQMFNSQLFPVYPKLQEQVFGETQVPFPEQAVESEEFFP
jgi:hypothetical protein